MKKILIILLFSIFFIGNSFSQDDTVCNKNCCAHHNVGVTGGYSHGYGLSYFYLGKKFGFQLSYFPVYNDDLILNSIALSFKFKLHNGERSCLLGYLSNNFILNYNDYFSGYENKINNASGLGIEMYIKLGKRIRLDIYTGYAFSYNYRKSSENYQNTYNLNNEYYFTPDGGIGLFYSF
jgi:hypothetical protein